jgi:phosphonate transport system ATP-binding protein
MSSPLIKLDNLSFTRDRQPILSDLNLTIYPQETIALIGPSGAGKTTLLRLLNTSLTPTSGRLTLFNRNIQTLSQRDRRHTIRQIGTIYQQFNLVPSLRVIHNLNAGRLGYWPTWKALLSLIYPLGIPAAQAVLAQVGIPEKLFDRTDRLSGGQQQRVAIARVLLQNPRVILADEPIASLDPALSREILTLLTKLCQEQGRTLIMSLHDVELARQFCDRIIGLRQGEILFDKLSCEVNEEQLQTLYRMQRLPTPPNQNG